MADRPVAKVTVATPSRTAQTVSSARPGRAKGSPRPRLTERGSRTPLSHRCTTSPRPPLGALPALIARAADSRCARSAGISAASSTTAGMPSAVVA